MANILVVDDSAPSRTIVTEIVKKCGHESVEAANGREALLAVAEREPDCIVLDLLMPEVDGFDVLRELQEQNSNVPVIVISADMREVSQKRCQDLGAAEFINKPVDNRDLEQSISRLLLRA